MNKIAGLIVGLVAQSAFASQMVVESSGTEIASGAGSTQKFAQLCVKNPAETRRRILVRTTWNIKDGGHLVALSPGTEMVYRLTLDNPVANANFAISYRKTAGLGEVETKALEVAFTDTATLDCAKLPQYRFRPYSKDGVCGVELVLVAKPTN